MGVGPADLPGDALAPAAGGGPTYVGVTVTFTASTVEPTTVTVPSPKVAASAGELTVNCGGGARVAEEILTMITRETIALLRSVPASTAVTSNRLLPGCRLAEKLHWPLLSAAVVFASSPFQLTWMVAPAVEVPRSTYVAVPWLKVIGVWAGSLIASVGFCVNL